MNIKKRGRRVALYRTCWVPKGPTVPHGYARHEYVASLAADAEEISEALRSRLTSDEQALVVQRVCIPANASRQAAAAEAGQKAVDPGWRLDEAAVLLSQAAALSLERGVSVGRVQAVQRELSAVRVRDGADDSRAIGGRIDPLHDALTAIEAATKALRDGTYGSAPSTGARNTRTYALWAQIVDAVDGRDGDCLLAALQERGFAKRVRR